MNPHLQDDVFGGGMGALLRSTDWSQTPLGPIETWPRSLVSYASMILAMPSPAIIFWGPEQTQIYNEGYAQIMGPRHPKYFGAPFRACWPDAYSLINPWMRKVLEQGEVIRVEREHIPLARYGFNEEAYFTFTFSALRDDIGAIAGIFQPVFEVTDAVLSERRDETLRALAPRGESVDAIRRAINALSANPKDIPFALVYLAGGRPELEIAGYTPNMSNREACFGGFAAAARKAFDQNRPILIDTAEVLLDGVAVGAWPELTRTALLVPLGQSTSEKPYGAVVFGISPRLHFDEQYRGFLELAAGQVTAGITRMRALQQVERQRQYLADLFMQAPASIAVLRGPEHIFELVNPLCKQFVGEREVIGKPIRVALPELNGRRFCEILDNVYTSGNAHVGREVPTQLDRTGDGRIEEAFFNFVCQPIRGSQGEKEGILIFAFEVTHQVRARQHSEALTDELKREHQRKDEFLAMLAHELRNPLAAASNAVKLLEPTISGEPGLRCVRILSRQTALLSELVDDLLDVSRITRGLVELKQEPVDLAAIARHAIESVQPMMDHKGHKVSVALPGHPVRVRGNDVRLEQVLVNLLANAAKYTDPGGKIALALDTTKDTVHLRIEDNGIGIERDVLEHIFDLFGQAERGLDRTLGGLGIGLTIARNLVELHGGTIAASSAGRGKGSAFLVTLPLLDTQHVPPLSAPIEAPCARGKRLLVVDDNRDTVETLALLLKDFGHEVEIAYDGAGALKKAREMVPHLILLDIGLPGMDGYQIARRLRQDPETSGTILVALTGYGQPRDRERTRECGFDAHFVKPVGIDALVQYIDYACKQPDSA